VNGAEREDEARRRALAVVEGECPNIAGNPFIPHFPTPKQASVLSLHQHEDMGSGILYGGAAGGGKSDLLLMAAAQFVGNPNFAALLLRRTYTELEEPGALLDRAQDWWRWMPNVRYSATDRVFHFPSGAKVSFAYLDRPGIEKRYQSAEFQLLGVDEVTHFKDQRQVLYLLSRLRRPADSDIPLRAIFTSNPGGPGHEWVKARFIGGTDPETGQYVAPICRYIPARIADNPHIDRAEYVRTLKHLHPTDRERLLNGDWTVRDPSDYFRAEWFGPFLDPETDTIANRDKVVVRWWDLAASLADDAAYTAGVKMARFRGGLRAVEHATSFRATPGDRDERIIQTAKADGHGVYVGIEIEPGSGGPAQFAALEKRLRAAGFKAVGARPKAELTNAEGRTLSRASIADKGKMARCDPVASCLETGYRRRGECPDTGGDDWGVDANVGLEQQRDGIRIYSGPWTMAYLDRVMGFPETGKDEADATSGGWAWLEAHPFGLRTPYAERTTYEPAELQNVHPEDRPDPAKRGQDRTGKWRP
jgi:phage terminase large subunit-like protein